MKSKYEKLLEEARKLKNCGKLSEAKFIYEKLIEAEPENLNNYFEISSIFHELNDTVNELKYLSEVAIKTHNERYLLVCSFLAEKLGNYELSAGFLNEILESNPENLTAMHKIALLYRHIDKQTSCDMFIELYENNKDNLEFLYMCILTSYEILRYKDCIKFAKEYLKATKDNDAVYTMAGNAYAELFDFRNAEFYLKTAYELNPTEENRLKYANICERNDKNESAFKLIGDINKISNNENKRLAEYTYMKINLKNKNHKSVGHLYFERNTKVPDKKTIAERAREMYHKLDVNERFNLSEEAFVQFRLNLEKEDCQKSEKLHSKLLRNEDFTNKKLLVYSSNGAGDLLMCVRYLPYMLKRTKDITLYVPKDMKELLQYSYPTLKIISNDENISFDEYDYTTTFMGFLYNLNIDLNNIPLSKGYLKIPDFLTEEKAQTDLIKNVSGKKIGIFWEGNAAILPNRSIKLKKLLPLFQKGRNIYSFQITSADEESFNLKKELEMTDLHPFIKNYADTGAFLKNIDVLITIDSSILHLAGALGVKTYLLLPYYSEWRWFYDTKTTPWYDSVRIFKQKEEGNWESVINEVNEALKDEFGI